MFVCFSINHRTEERWRTETTDCCLLISLEEFSLSPRSVSPGFSLTCLYRLYRLGLNSFLRLQLWNISCSENRRHFEPSWWQKVVLCGARKCFMGKWKRSTHLLGLEIIKLHLRRPVKSGDVQQTHLTLNLPLLLTTELFLLQLTHCETPACLVEHWYIGLKERDSQREFLFSKLL